MNRLFQLIRYFVDHIPGCGRTQIVKYLYLADYEAYRFLGRPITQLTYRFDQHGPFDPAILTALDALCERNVVRQDQLEYAQGKVAYRYFNAVPVDEETGFDAAERSIINSIVINYGCMPLQNLLDDVVYQTEPMLDAVENGAYRELLRMDLVVGAARMPGLELEEVWEADADLQAGRGRRLDDVISKRS